MFDFQILKQSKADSLRWAQIKTAWGKANTPCFMPCATVGAVKTLAPDESRQIGVEILLANTYHLFLRPGEKLIQRLGGLHNFMNWSGPILTDSGGFQVFSLSGRRGESLVKITEEGVEFRSHLDGSRHFLTPERVIEIQYALGSDILMPLDYCTTYPCSRKGEERAVQLTLDWAERSKRKWLELLELETKNSNLSLESNLKQKENLKQKRGKQKGGEETLTFKPVPVLFGIVQGGVYLDLRRKCASELIRLDFPGYAIGGVAVGEPKRKMWSVIKEMNQLLPKDKPRYLMGVGEPADLIQAAKLGMDMFDCVLPTRLARHGAVWVKEKGAGVDARFKRLSLTKSVFKEDRRPIEEGCGCKTCQEGFSRAYLHHLMKEGEMLGHRLLTIHNLWVVENLVRSLRESLRP